MDLNFLIFSVVKIAGVIGILHAIAAYAVLAERKISAWIQDRVGPNRTAPPFMKFVPVLGPMLTRMGIFQPLADGLKFMLKEDFTPDNVRKIYFWLAPALAVIPSMLVIAVVPFGSMIGGQKMVIADLTWEFFTRLVSCRSVFTASCWQGYAANSKYPFLGGIRSSAQMISYEISMGMSVIPVFLIAGGLNLSGIITWQTQHHWLIFYAPLSFVIFLVAAFAETNRTPFDLPEAETELVGGYHTEYGSMKFALFFLAEYSNIVATTASWSRCFSAAGRCRFGDWDQPATSVGVGILHILIFLAKVCALITLFIWGALDVPAFPLRPVDGSGLASVHSAGAREHFGDGNNFVDAKLNDR